MKSSTIAIFMIFIVLVAVNIEDVNATSYSTTNVPSCNKYCSRSKAQQRACCQARGHTGLSGCLRGRMSCFG
uniref:Uncharacterized protein n=1 Tax=Panagrolaimus superbus TaxID=310955 RepID=A0A914YDX1_9BILA